MDKFSYVILFWIFDVLLCEEKFVHFANLWLYRSILGGEVLC